MVNAMASAGTTASATSSRLAPPRNRPDTESEREADADEQLWLGHVVKPTLRLAGGDLGTGEGCREPFSGAFGRRADGLGGVLGDAHHGRTCAPSSVLPVIVLRR